MTDALFTILRDGVTLSDGTHIKGYEISRFYALNTSYFRSSPSAEAMVEMIRKLDPARPWENVA